MVQVVPQCKYRGLSQPRVSLVYLNIYTNLSLPFFCSSVYVPFLGKGMTASSQITEEVRAVWLLLTHKRGTSNIIRKAGTTLVFLAVISFSYSFNFQCSNHWQRKNYILSYIFSTHRAYIFQQHMTSAHQFLAYFSMPNYTVAQSRIFDGRNWPGVRCSFLESRGWIETTIQTHYDARLLLNSSHSSDKLTNTAKKFVRLLWRLIIPILLKGNSNFEGFLQDSM